MNLNSFDFDRLRIEIAILQEDVLAKNPGVAKFKIPVIITEDTVSHIETSNSNIINRRNGNLSSSSINIENTIKLKIPTEFTYFYGKEIVPAGTRFLVAFVGGNINDIKIISRYDSIDTVIKEESKEEVDLDKLIEEKVPPIINNYLNKKAVLHNSFNLKNFSKTNKYNFNYADENKYLVISNWNKDITENYPPNASENGFIIFTFSYSGNLFQFSYNPHDTSIYYRSEIEKNIWSEWINSYNSDSGEVLPPTPIDPPDIPKNYIIYEEISLKNNYFDFDNADRNKYLVLTNYNQDNCTNYPPNAIEDGFILFTVSPNNLISFQFSYNVYDGTIYYRREMEKDMWSFWECLNKKASVGNIIRCKYPKMINVTINGNIIKLEKNEEITDIPPIISEETDLPKFPLLSIILNDGTIKDVYNFSIKNYEDPIYSNHKYIVINDYNEIFITDDIMDPNLIILAVIDNNDQNNLFFNPLNNDIAFRFINHYTLEEIYSNETIHGAQEYNNIFNNYNIPQGTFKVNLNLQYIKVPGFEGLQYIINISGDLYSSVFKKLYQPPLGFTTVGVVNALTYYIFYNLDKKCYSIFTNETIYSFTNTYDYNNSIFIFSFDQYGYKNMIYSSNHYYLNDIEIHNSTFYKDRAIVINGEIHVYDQGGSTNNSALIVSIKNLECLDPTNLFQFTVEDKEISLSRTYNLTHRTALFGIKRTLLNIDQYGNKKYSSELVFNEYFPYTLQYDNLNPEYYNLYLFTVYGNDILYDLPYHKGVFFQNGKDIFD